MKTSDVLVLAKQRLAYTINQGICSAIINSDVSWVKTEPVVEMIGSRLNGFAFASDWLGAQVLFGQGCSMVDLSSMQYKQIREWRDQQKEWDIQAWRHAWLDQLIAEFQAKGD
jgi:hypothetical protein